MHISLQLSIKAGIMLTFSCPPGVHGAVRAGTHGIGVSAPIAAAVAEATVGLASDWHMPNGAMLTIGLLSMMFAMGLLSIIGRIGSMMVSGVGAFPNEHFSCAPIHTYFAIVNVFRCYLMCVLLFVFEFE